VGQEKDSGRATTKEMERCCMANCDCAVCRSVHMFGDAHTVVLGRPYPRGAGGYLAGGAIPQKNHNRFFACLSYREPPGWRLPQPALCGLWL